MLVLRLSIDRKRTKKNMAALDETVSEAVRQFPVLYEKYSNDFKGKTRNENA